MFEVGFTEIVLILGIALIVLGPEKLPRVASQVGRWLGRARVMARQLKIQLDEETLKTEQPWMKQRRTWQPPAPGADAPAAAQPPSVEPTTAADPAAEPPAAPPDDAGRPPA